MWYTIFDRDVFTNSGEFILQGEHYYALIKYCIENSDCFSLFRCRFGQPLDDQLNKWNVPPLVVNADEDTCLVFYKSCKETYTVLTQIIHSFFDTEDESNLYTHDITFYRSDGTVLMETVLHEGECSIYPREDESVDELLSFGSWILFNDTGIIDMPAADHPLPAPKADEVSRDPLYILLQEIRNAPERLLPSATADSLEQFIQKYDPIGLSAGSIRTNLQISALPRWFVSFKNYVQGKNGCSTATEIARAICGDKYAGYDGFVRFYELLDEYVQTVCVQHR